jgi:hypothetical protein
VVVKYRVIRIFFSPFVAGELPPPLPSALVEQLHTIEGGKVFLERRCLGLKAGVSKGG